MIAKVYCSGSIMKGSSTTAGTFWTDVERADLARGAAPNRIAYLNPDDPIDPSHRELLLFGRDMCQVSMADFVVVDARERRGLGIGIEILTSKVFGRPLVVVAPRNSYYRSDVLTLRGAVVHGYVHPHIAVLADAIVQDFVDAGRWIRHCMDRPIKAKTIDALNEAIEAYKSGALPDDEPMQEVLRLVGNIDPQGQNQ